jgi:hypothetical protein
MHCRPTRLEVWLIALLLALAPVAGAQEPAPGPGLGSVRGDVLSARLRYGLELRRGEQRDLGPGLAYSGSTPNGFALDASYFLGGGALGLSLSAERTAFSLRDGSTEVTSGALYRGQLLPTLRLAFGVLELQAMAGYGFAQVPDFGSSASPVLAATSRHSALVGLKAGLFLPVSRPMRLEVEGLLPVFSLVSEDSARSSGFSAGAHAVVQLAQRGQLAYSAVLSGQLLQDDLTAPLSPAGEKRASQRLLRAGIGLEVALLQGKAPPVPRFGGLLVRVVDAETGQPVPEASALLVAGDLQLALVAGEGGFQAEDVAPGPVVVKAGAPGYLAAEASATVVPGERAQVELALRPEPRFGAVELKLVDKLTQQPVTKVQVEIRGQKLSVSPEGTLRVADLPPGPLPLTVTAPGYRKAQEVVAVVAGQTEAVTVELVKVAGKLPARVSGLVRSRRGGTPLRAKLEIAAARIRTEAGPNGAFQFDIPAGTYRVVISAPGHLSQSKRFTVKEGGEAIFNIDLYPSRGR